MDRAKQDVFCDITSITKHDLVVFLKARGLPVHGNKKEIYDRAFGAHLLKLPLKEDRQNPDGPGVHCRVDRLTTPQGEALPDPNTLVDWQVQVGVFPTFSYKDLF